MNTQPSDMTKPHAPRALGLYAVPRSGEVPGSRIIELFAHASSERFNGSLTIEPTHGAKIVFRIQRGNITRWQSLDDHTFILQALGESLPPEQVDFVRRHAFESNLDEFGAAARLGLLQLDAIEWIHRGATARLIRGLSEPRRRYRYAFSQGLDCFEGQDGFSQSIPALWLLCECLVAGEILGWCRERLLGLADAPMRMTALGRSLAPSLVGRPRQIVLKISNGPESLDALREHYGGMDAALLGTVYALLATGAAELVADSGIVPRPGESLAPSGFDRIQRSRETSDLRFKVLREGEWISPGSYRSGPVKGTSSAGMSSSSPSSPSPGSSSPTSPRPSTSRESTGTRAVESRVRTSPQSGVGPVVSRPGDLDDLEMDISERPTARPPSTRANKSPDTVRVRPRAESNWESTSGPESAPGKVSSSPPRLTESALESAALDLWSRALGGDRMILLKAEAQVEKMVNLFPKNASILYYLGALYHLTGKTFEAETTLLRVIELDTEHIGAREELIRVRRTIESERKTPAGLLKRLVGKNT